MAKQVLTFPRDRQRRDRDDERRFAVDAVGSPRERTNEQERNRKQEKKRERRTVKIRKKKRENGGDDWRGWGRAGQSQNLMRLTDVKSKRSFRERGSCSQRNVVLSLSLFFVFFFQPLRSPFPALRLLSPSCHCIPERNKSAQEGEIVFTDCSDERRRASRKAARRQI